MKYQLVFSEQSQADLKRLKHYEQKAFEKACVLLKELMEHPTTGTGKPEILKGNRSGLWSRRITLRHRLVYEINGLKVLVYILSAYGHYDEK